jgi:hypothetical protein
MWNSMYFVKLVKGFLPDKAKILIVGENKDKPALLTVDLDGDGLLEIAAAYRYEEENHIAVLKNYCNFWHLLANIKGTGRDINYFNAAPITEKHSNDLVVGWQIEDMWSELNILKWTEEGFENVAQEDMSYSKIAVEDMTKEKGESARCDIALWYHDAEKAYKIEVYKWINGILISDKEVYPYYFKKVSAYYKRLTKEEPNSPIYWYYLADAQIKAGRKEEALQTVESAMKFEEPYPSRELLVRLRVALLLDKIRGSENLHTAVVKTIDGNKWGYINDKGEFIIRPQYDYAEDFQDYGLAVVTIANNSGVINTSGKYILEPVYETIGQFSEGRAAVKDKDGFKVVDEAGKVITKDSYEYIGTYQDRRALFSSMVNESKYLYGYLDREGNEVIPAKYENAYDFNNGKALVQIADNDYGLINSNGEILSRYNYNFVGDHGDGLLAFKKTIDGKFGYMDEAGNVVIPPQFDSALPFEAGRAVVGMAQNYLSRYGVIDKEGNFIIKLQYDIINYLGENRFSVGRALDEEKPYLSYKYAIADENGRFLTDFIFDQISNYENGMTSVSDEKETFFADERGKKVKRLPAVEGSGTLTLEGNLVKVNVDQRVYYLDKTGKVVWQPNTVISLNNQYRVVEEKYKPNKDYLVYYPRVEGMTDTEAQNNVNEKLKELSLVKPIDSGVQLDYSYTGDFSVEFFKKNLLALELYGYEYPFGAAHGMPTEIYPHIDLVSGQFYELKDLFKKNSDYVKVISDIVGEQIKNNPDKYFIFPDAYKGIKEDQPFYVDEDTLYIYFFPYEIAAFAAGFPTFEIPFNDIMNIIDTEGDFWGAFN